MSTLEIAGARPYRVRIERGALACAPALVAGRAHAVLSDSTVAPLHAHRLALGGAPLLALEPGEGAKSFQGLERVLDFLAEAEVDRPGVLVTLGGGVITDLGGLAASLHLRGIDVVHAPTTLLAQVDASVGGKTAINLRAGKNLAGTFHTPLEVLIDPDVLTTQSDEEFAAGLGEVVKSALVGSAALLEVLEEHAEAVRAREPVLLERIVVGALEVKAAVVGADERETGQRASLNLGHTFAHALEHAAGFGRIPHGVAVAVGLVLALRASARAGVLRDPTLPSRVGSLLERLGLVTRLDQLERRYDLAWEPAALRAGLRHDKKGRVGQPAFVLVREAGCVVWGQRLPEATWAPLLDPGFRA